MSAEAPATSLEAIAASPNARYISPDRAVKSTLDDTTAAVNANAAYQSGFTGSGIGIAIIDSGVNLHPDLNGAGGRSRIVYGESCVPGDFLTIDEYGHGAHVAGIAAIDRAIQLKSIFNIGVINLSLGRSVFESFTLDPLCQAVEAAWRNGIVVVAAAGNDGRDNSYGNNGYGAITAPGNDPYPITVGARHFSIMW